MIVVFLFCMMMVAQSTNTADGAEPDCPCLSFEDAFAALGAEVGQWEYLGYEDYDESCVYMPSHQLDPSIPQAETEMLCYPLDYGFGRCDTWDFGLKPACHDHQSLWCDQPWCYVSDLNCGVAHAKSSFINTKMVDVYYSYATCGAQDFYTTGEGISNNLIGMNLKVAFLHNTGGWKGVFWDDDIGTWTGPTKFLVDRISGDAGFTMTEKPISSYAMEAQPSSNFSACIEDIGFGRLNLCIALCSETPTRISTAPMTPQIAPNLVYLYVKNVELENEISVWSPFSNELWFTASMAVIFVAFLMQTYETRLPYKKTKALKQHTREWGNKVYDAFLYVFGSSVSWNPRTLEARVLAFGFGFFILVLVNLYAAQLTANLIIENEGTLNTIYDFETNRDLKICTIRVLKSLLLAQTDLDDEQVVTSLGRNDAGQGLEDGLCDGVAIDFETYENWQANGMYCDLVQTGDSPLLTLSYAMYTTPDIHRVFSWYITHYKTTGLWNEIVDAFYRAPVCDAIKSDSDPLDMQVKLRHSNQVFGVLIIFLCLSILIHAYKKCCPDNSNMCLNEDELKRKQRKKEELEELGADYDDPYNLSQLEILNLKNILSKQDSDKLQTKKPVEGEEEEMGGDSFEFKRRVDLGFEENLKKLIELEVKRRVENFTEY